LHTKNEFGSAAGKRLAAALIAITAWTALGLQLHLIVHDTLSKGAPLAPALIGFFSYFTILTNGFVASVLTLTSIDPVSARYWNRPSLNAEMVLYIVIVAIVYVALLQNLTHPQGLSLLADRLLHRAVPGLIVVYWLVFIEKGLLRWRDPVLWLVYPILYAVYAIARGAYTGRYPYGFLNISKLGIAQTMLNGVGLLALFLCLGLLVVAADRFLSGTGREKVEA